MVSTPQGGGQYAPPRFWPGPPRDGGSSDVQPAAHLDSTVDSHDIVGNTMSATRDPGGALDARSQRRLYERLAELDGRDPVQAGESLEAMPADERATELRRAVTAFQQGDDGGAMDDATRERHRAERAQLIAQIRDDNAVGAYDPAGPRVSPYDAPEAAYTDGEAGPNDATMQAIANSWPQTLLGRSMTEEQAFNVLVRLVLGRGLPFEPNNINVIGMRGFQGEMHDNGEPQGRVYTQHNRYDDTVYLVTARDGHHVQRARGTVDPGGGRQGREPLRFQVAGDQQWDYQGNARGQTRKYDRALYGPDGRGLDPMDVTRGRHWQSHEEDVDGAGAGGRLIRRPDGELQTDRDSRGRPRLVSAVHSGGGGSASGEQVLGDSTGCTVVHGEWFAHFNESLRRAAGGDAVRFTYSMIDLRTYTARELTTILDSVVPQPSSAGSGSSSGSGSGTPGRRVVADFATVPSATRAPRTP